MAVGRSWCPERRPGRWSAQKMGGDIVYIAAKNAVFADRTTSPTGPPRPTGPPGPAAGGRTRRTRDPGQRGQPQRGRPRVGHLRRRLGSQACSRLRCRRGGARRGTTPGAPCSSERSCPNTSPPACSPSRRPTSRRPRAARAGGRRRRRGFSLRPTTRGERGRPGDGGGVAAVDVGGVQRPGARGATSGPARLVALTQVGQLGQRAGARARGARSSGSCSAAVPGSPTGCGPRRSFGPPRLDRDGHLGGSTTGCSAATARCSATRCTTATRAPTAVAGAGAASSNPAAEHYADHRGAGAARSPRSSSSSPRPIRASPPPSSCS